MISTQKNPIVLAALMGLALVASSCTADTIVTNTTSGRYQLTVAREGLHYLTDTKTGALYLHQQDGWMKVAAPIPNPE